MANLIHLVLLLIIDNENEKKSPISPANPCRIRSFAKCFSMVLNKISSRFSHAISSVSSSVSSCGMTSGRVFRAYWENIFALGNLPSKSRSMSSKNDSSRSSITIPMLSRMNREVKLILSCSVSSSSRMENSEKVKPEKPKSQRICCAAEDSSSAAIVSIVPSDRANA